jgi:hypothetical protein
MHNCNTCLSNTKTREYKYQMFDSYEQNHSKDTEDLLIEGVINMTGTVQAVDNMNKSGFSKLARGLEYKTCSRDNDILCEKLNTELANQTEKVTGIYTDYIDKQLLHETCDLPNIKCANIQNDEEASRKIITGIKTTIPEKIKLLSKCNKLKQEVKDIQKFIKLKNEEAVCLTKDIKADIKMLSTIKCENITAALLQCDMVNTSIDIKCTPPADIEKNDFDTTMTTSEFMKFLETKKSQLNTEFNDIQQSHKELSSTMRSIDNKANVINTRNKVNITLPPKYNTSNQYASKIRRYRSWWYYGIRRYYQRRKNDVDSDINRTKGTVNKYNNHLNSRAMRGIDINQKANTGKLLDSNKKDATKNMKNKQTLNDQDDWYKNRPSVCNAMHDIIKDENKLLSQYCEIINEQNNILTKKTEQIKNECSTINPDIINKLKKQLENETTNHNNISQDWQKNCEGYKWDCSKYLTDFNQAETLYNTENDVKIQLDNSYNICIDPTKNKCKDILMDYKSKSNRNEINTRIVNSKQEGFTDAEFNQFTETINNNKKNYNELKQSVREFDDFNNNYTNKNGIGTQNKLNYDKTIMINILLTAIASSILYCTFVNI